MNHLDFIVLILLVLAAVKGFSRGFIISLASLAGIVFGVLFSLKYAGAVNTYLIQATGSNSGLLFLAGYGICFTAIVLFMYIVGKSLEKVIEIAALGMVNRLAGIALGVLKTLIILSAILFLLNIADPGKTIIKKETRENSLFYEPLEWLLPAALPFLKSQLDNIEDPFEKHSESGKTPV